MNFNDSENLIGNIFICVAKVTMNSKDSQTFTKRKQYINSNILIRKRRVSTGKHHYFMSKKKAVSFTWQILLLLKRRTWEFNSQLITNLCKTSNVPKIKKSCRWWIHITVTATIWNARTNLKTSNENVKAFYKRHLYYQ